MTEITSEVPSFLFNDCIPVAFISRSARNKEGISSRIRINLKIGERCFDNNDMEVRVEVSRPDEFRFVFAEGITRQKYSALRDSCHLNTDFESFARSITQTVKNRDSVTPPVTINCVLDEERDVCTLELVSRLALQTSKISIRMRRVVGEELNNHLIVSIGRLRKDFEKMAKEKKKAIEEEREKIKALEEKEESWKVEKISLQEELRTLREDVAAFESDLQMERNEKEVANAAAEQLRYDLNLADEEKESLEDELQLLNQHMDDMDIKLENASDRRVDAEEALVDERKKRERAERALEEERRKREKVDADYKKAKDVIRKQLKVLKECEESTAAPSMDERKLVELRADIEEKDKLIQELKKADRARSALLESETTALRAQLDQYKKKEEQRAQLVDHYRRGGASGALASPLGRTPSAASPSAFPTSMALCASPLSYPGPLGRGRHNMSASAARLDSPLLNPLQNRIPFNYENGQKENFGRVEAPAQPSGIAAPAQPNK